MLVIEKGKIVKSFGIELPDGKVIKLLQEGESYKYLGILEADKFLEEKMKLNVSKEYIRRLRKVLKSKLNGGNLVREVNTWAVSLLRYSYRLLEKTRWWFRSCKCSEEIKEREKIRRLRGESSIWSVFEAD